MSVFVTKSFDKITIADYFDQCDVLAIRDVKYF